MRFSLRQLALAAFLMMVPACGCGPLGIDSTRFACTTDDDCVEGFVCSDIGSGLECVTPEQVLTVTDAGEDSGTPDSGTPDAGEEDAGLDAGEDAGLDAGEDDAGTDAGELDAGDDAGADAGDDAGTDAGAPDAGFDAGIDAGFDAGFDAGTVDAGPPATRLAITTPPQTTATGSCSQVFLVETRDLNMMTTPVLNATTVGLDGGSPLITFYSASNCGGAPTTTVSVPATQSLTTFYARGADAGVFNISASATGFTSAAQSFTVMNPPTSLVFTTTPPSSMRAGTCLTATVEARRGTVATPVTSNTTVTLAPVNTGAVRFYSDSACANSISSVSMATNDTTAVFFMKPMTGGMQTINANAPFGTASQILNVTSAVRRGMCVMPPATFSSDGGIVTSLTTTCTIAPALTSTAAAVLFTQSTGLSDGGTGVPDGGLIATDGGVGAYEARCRISTTAAIACSRAQDNAAAEIHYQVAELPVGFTGQRQNLTGCPTVTSFTTAITPSQSFVLKASQSDSLNFDDDDTLVGELLNTTQVGLSPNACTGADVQLLTWSGLSVTRTRVDGGFPTGASTLTVSGLPVISNGSLLVSPATTLDAQRSICSAMVRATAPSTSSVTFTRGAGDAGCTFTAMESLFYERIDWGTRAVVRQYTATFTPGQFVRPIAVTAVDTTRTVVFSSTQLVGGQGTGETDEAGPSAWLEAGFQLVLTSATNVNVIRTSANSNASVTFYVAELVP